MATEKVIDMKTTETKKEEKEVKHGTILKTMAIIGTGLLAAGGLALAIAKCVLNKANDPELPATENPDSATDVE